MNIFTLANIEVFISRCLDSPLTILLRCKVANIDYIDDPEAPEGAGVWRCYDAIPRPKK